MSSASSSGSESIGWSGSSWISSAASAGSSRAESSSSNPSSWGGCEEDIAGFISQIIWYSIFSKTDVVIE